MIRAIFPCRRCCVHKAECPANILEQRYLSMLSQVPKSGEGFVVVLIKTGRAGECSFMTGCPRQGR